MGIFTWNEKFSVQVEEMDDQHKVLFDLINQLHDAMSTGKGNEIMAGILAGLKDYTLTHFSKEEKYLESFHYSGIAEQKKQHQLFVEKISEYEQKLTEKKLGLSIDVLHFLRDWLIQHIQTIDAKYADSFHSHGKT